MKDDIEFRKKVSAEVGVGFQYPAEIQAEKVDFVPNVPKKSYSVVVESVVLTQGITTSCGQ